MSLRDNLREVELLRGEALFKVAHEAKRPFRVRTALVTVLAVGTEFNVKRRPDGETLVSVVEGRVKISSLHNKAGEDVDAGEAARILPQGILEPKGKAEISNAIAWRERRLVFEGTPLEDIVYEFNRYSSRVRLKLLDIAPNSHRYNGIFNAADPASLADILDREPDLTIERRPGEIVIKGRPD